MAKLKDVYDFLEESGKGEFVNVVKGELSEITTLSQKKGEYKNKFEESQKTLESFNPFMKIINNEKLTVESIADMIKKSRDGESDLDAFRRELDSYKNQVSDLTKTLSDRDKKLKETEREKNNATLKDIFSKELGSIIPKIRDNELSAYINRGDIMYDSEGKAVGKIDGVLYEPKQFAEKYIAANPEFVAKVGGAGSESGNTFTGKTKDWGDSSSNNLIGEGLTARGL